MPKISIVISVYNKEKYVAKTLQSVMDQTFQDFEVVILNDGSTDKSEAAIFPFTKDARVRYYFEENKGASAGRNFTIKKAMGQYIALLDADDVWHSNHLCEINRLIENHPSESVFATNSEIIINNKIINRHFSIDTKNKSEVVVDFFEASYLDSILNSSSTVLHKRVFEKVGLYDVNLKSTEDIDFFVRVGINFKVVFSPKICVKIIIDNKSLSHISKKTSDKANFSVYEKLEKKSAALKKFLDLNRYSLCLLAKLEGNDGVFIENFQKIDLKNISKKQLFLLKQNATTLKFLFKTKESLQNLGIRLSVFK